VEEMKKAGVKVLRGDEWQVEGNSVIKKGKVYVPKDEELSKNNSYQCYNMFCWQPDIIEMILSN